VAAHGIGGKATLTLQSRARHTGYGGQESGGESGSEGSASRLRLSCVQEEGTGDGKSRREEELSMSIRAVVRALVGNAFITTAKFGAYFFTGSAAMLSEAIHTLVDTANQMLLYFGIKQAQKQPDKRHHYGYGRNAFFYALLSGMGMFWVGSGAVLMNAAESLADLPAEPVQYGMLTWSVLLMSFAIDGSVLVSTLHDLYKTKKPDETLWQHVQHIRDPMIKAVVYEDMAACTGVVLAIGGIGLSYATNMALWDPLSSAGVGVLLGAVAVNLVRMNKSFLLGQSIEKDIEKGIEKLLLAHPSVEAVYAVSNTWEGPTSFTYKADVDFRGGFFADQLESRYLARFQQQLDEEELRQLLREYSENLTRMIEKEVYTLQAHIKDKYEEAHFIEIQPHSTLSKGLVGDPRRPDSKL